VSVCLITAGIPSPNLHARLQTTHSTAFTSSAEFVSLDDMGREDEGEGLCCAPRRRPLAER
jgi:hypothetical protein